MRVIGPVVDSLERSLDVRLQRQEVLGSNVANLDTPGFSPVDVDLAAGLAGPAGRMAVAAVPRHAGHLELGLPDEGGPAPIIDGPARAPGLDGNRVDLDRTMAVLAENALQYAAAARVTQRHLALLRYVASDGNS
ncbi:MAG: flagellar basal body rod protein FlgB [Deltaproteobacteria bacterium]|nr:flagellar basal body rod protein FlgB [Deltaproteobacteria bacterium]